MGDYTTSQTFIRVDENSRIMPGVVIGSLAEPFEAVHLRYGAKLEVFGAVVGNQGILVESVSSGTTPSVVTIHASGSVAGGITGRAATVINYGMISNPYATAFFTGAAVQSATVRNYGTMVGRAGALGVDLVNAGDIIGLSAIGAGATTLRNSGTITGVDGAEADHLTNSGTISGTGFGASIRSSLLNTGTITGGATGLSYDYLSDISIRNSGLIAATDANGRAIASASAAFTRSVIDNDGRIVADGPGGVAIATGDGKEIVTNRGTITGLVTLGGNDDSYDGRTGTLNGTLLLGNGADVALGGVSAETMHGDLDDDRLEGGGGDDVLDGGADNDVLIGGAGRDRMTGGVGNDTFYVDDARDLVFEGADGGADTVYASVSYTLRAGQEVEALTADSDGDFLGLALTGNALAQTITGDAGANRVTGGGGADTLIGLTGDDTYVVSDAAAVVVEGANAGFDTVLTSVSYALPDNVEALRTSNARGTAAIDLTGNARANELTGNNGANVLDGGAGADVMTGGLGDDTYIVDNAGDVVRDTGGFDSVVASVDWTLAGSVERLVLATGGLIGRGSAGANELVGSAGDDVLSGRQGLDTLTGGLGADRFLFETGARGGDADIITDFSSGEDVIALDDAVFRRIGGPGALDARFFTEGAATTRDHHILYDVAAGTLAFDFDGSGAAYAAVVFATVHPAAVLSVTDIIVV